MTRERAIEVLKAWDLNWSDEFTANEFEQAFAMAISALSENKRGPTDEEVIEYCNKRGYVICTQAFIDDLKREKHRIRFEGYVGVDDMGRYDPYTDSFVKGGE